MQFCEVAVTLVHCFWENDTSGDSSNPSVANTDANIYIRI